MEESSVDMEHAADAMPSRIAKVESKSHANPLSA
jgi:hypothetical protein